jgi:transposase
MSIRSSGILSEVGELTEGRIKSTRANFDEVFAGRTQARILVEASTGSEWVASHLEQPGQQVIVADPNFVTALLGLLDVTLH